MVSKALGLLWDGVAEQVDAETVGNGLSHELSSQGPSSAQTLRRATARLARLDTERLKLVHMAYADAIPLDLLKREQARISAEREQTERELAQTERHGPAIERVYRHAADLMRRAAAIYALADDDNRRLLNRAFVARITVHVDEAQAQLGTPWHERSCRRPIICGSNSRERQQPRSAGFPHCQPVGDARPGTGHSKTPNQFWWVGVRL